MRERLARVARGARACAPRAIAVPPGEASKSYAGLRAGLRRASSPPGSSAATSSSRSAAASSATSPASRPRSCAAACASCRSRRRCSPRSIPPSAARPASTRRTARTSSAPSTSRAWSSPTPASSTPCRAREMRAGYAEVVKYGLIDDAAFFAWCEANWRGDLRGRPGARRGRGAELPRQGRGRRARRARGRRPRAAQPRPHLRARAGAADRLRRRAPRPRRGASPSALRSPSASRRRLGLCPGQRRGRASRRISRTVGLPTRLADVPGGAGSRRRAPRRDGAGQEGQGAAP